jgi:hypothetical protein
VKKKTLFLIATGVVAAHAVAFYFVAGLSPLPKVPYVPPPNFSVGWANFTDPATREKMVYQEFTVSTHILKPAPGTAPAASPEAESP